MRDINRIKPFLKEVERCWKRVPDWRFGQLIVNWFGLLEQGIDPFFPEEKELLDALHKLFNKEER